LHYLRTGDAERCARKLSECARTADLSGTPFDGSALLSGLRAAVDFAWYWQEPDDEDQGFAGEAAREALRPIAEAVVAATGTPDARWWTEPVDRSRQRYTQFLDQHPLPEPLLTGAAESAGPGWRTPLMMSGQRMTGPKILPRHTAVIGGQVRRTPGYP